MNKKIGLFLGRFQPFHNGHLLVVEGMTKMCDEIIIGIGSSNAQNEPDNPFTAEERRDMIQNTLQAKDLIPMFDIRLMDFPDQESDMEWADHVLESVGDIEKVWTGNELTKKCFEGKVDIQNIVEVPGISSTEIRALMKSGGYWEEKLPNEVVKYLKSIDGTKRV
jgi:nicotinamide-nucleotide adenylyltransferase